MQFTVQEDIQAPINAVFEMVADFERFERMAMRRGIEVRRLSGHMGVVPGTKWQTDFTLRGKPRHVEITMAHSDPPAQMRFEAIGKGVGGVTEVDLLALSQRRTRLSVDVTLTAKSLPARLFLQSLRLGKSRFRARFQSRLTEFAREMEERHLHGS